MFLYQKLNYNVNHINSEQDIQKMVETFNNEKPVYMGFDTETDGLHIITSTPFLLTFGFGKHLYYVTNINYFHALDVAKECEYLFAHNCKFDYHMGLNIGYEFEGINLADSMTVARLTSYADDNESISLEALGTKYVDENSKFAGKIIQEKINEINKERLKYIKGLIKNKYPKVKITEVMDAYKKRIQYVKYDDELEEIFELIDKNYKEPNYKDVYKKEPELMISYALDDIVILLEYLKKAMPVLVKVDEDFKVMKLESELIKVDGKRERKGFNPDIDYLIESRNRVIKYREETYQKLWELAGQEFSVGQHKVIKELFLDKFNINMDNCDIKALKDVRDKNDNEAKEIANLIIELRTVDKWLSTYIEGMLNRITNGRIYSPINSNGAVTGRVSGDFQQQPRDPLTTRDGEVLYHPRKVIINDKGTKLFFMDFNAMELRVQAEYTLRVGDGDYNLCNAFMPFKHKSMFTGEEFNPLTDDWDSGEWVDDNYELWQPTDLHSSTALKAFPHLTGKEPDFKEYYRYLGKRTNFLLVYGGGVRALQDSLDVDEETANALNKGFYSAFPKVKEYQNWVNNQLTSYGYATNLYGRRYYMQRSDSFYKAYNYLIQGSCAYIVKEKQVEIAKFLEPYKSYILYPIHDEIIFVIYDDEEFLVPEINKIMNDNKKYLKYVPLISEIEYTKTSWADKENYKVEDIL